MAGTQCKAYKYDIAVTPGNIGAIYTYYNGSHYYAAEPRKMMAAINNAWDCKVYISTKKEHM